MISITVINVGYGDSIVLHLSENNNDKWGIIDCHNPKINLDSPTLTFLKKNNVNNLEFLCLTHPDYDHYSGMEQLIRYFSEDGRTIRKFYDFGMDITKYTSFLNSSRQEAALKSLYKLIYKLINENKIIWEQLSVGKTILKLNNFHFVSKGPFQKDAVKYLRNVGKRLEDFSSGEKVNIDKNLLSVITLIEYENYLILLTSDATKENIEFCLQKLDYPNSKFGKNKFAFIKVPHHGSINNNHSGLWQKHTQSGKSFAAISSGNKHGHPHIEVVRDITSNKIDLYCTNKSGCLMGLPPKKLVAPSRITNPKIQEGLDLISSTVPICSPYHGNISFESDGYELSIETEFKHPPVRI